MGAAVTSTGRSGAADGLWNKRTLDSYNILTISNLLYYLKVASCEQGMPHADSLSAWGISGYGY